MSWRDFCGHFPPCGNELEHIEEANRIAEETDRIAREAAAHEAFHVAVPASCDDKCPFDLSVWFAALSHFRNEIVKPGSAETARCIFEAGGLGCEHPEPGVHVIGARQLEHKAKLRPIPREAAAYQADLEELAERVRKGFARLAHGGDPAHADDCPLCCSECRCECTCHRKRGDQ